MARPRAESKTDSNRTEYHARIEREQLTPLWEFFHDWFTLEPRVQALPHRWRYPALRSLVLDSAQVISPEEAERRVLVLENPGLKGRHLITDSLYAGLQLIMPGEVAPSHRHSPAALRFIVEGQGAYTSVNGEKTYMEPGDFIVTPSWTWHEHGHEGTGPTVWMDVLDVAIVRFLGASFTELYPGRRFPERVPARDSLYRYGMNMVPAGYQRTALPSPIFSYPYARAREVLERLKQHTEWDRCHALSMEYIDPTTGGPAIPTISTFLQLIPKGFATESYRSTDGRILCVVEGRGRIALGENREIEYAPWDICAIPSWQPFAVHAEQESVIFSASDQAIQKKLGIWRELRPR